MTSAPVPGRPAAGQPRGRRRRSLRCDDDGRAKREQRPLLASSALTAEGDPVPTRRGQADRPGRRGDSGLIDIRQLSAQLHSSDDKKKNRIDDIMNLRRRRRLQLRRSGARSWRSPRCRSTPRRRRPRSPAAAARSKGVAWSSRRRRRACSSSSAPSGLPSR